MPRRAKGLTALGVKNAKAGPDGKPKRYAAGGNLYLLVRRAALRPGETVPDGGDHPLVKFWIWRYSPPSKITKAGVLLPDGTLSKGGRKGHREMGLGPASGPAALSLSEAERRAADLLRQFRDGIDPIAAKQAKRAADIAKEQRDAVRAVTFADAVEKFLADKVDGRAGANEKHLAQWRMTLTTYAIPHFGSVPVADVDTSHVLAALRPIWSEKAETASRLRGRIEAVLDFAKVHKWRGDQPNPAVWKGNLALALKARGEVAKVEHHAALDWRRIPEFMAALRKREGTSARALEFAILCASRSGEIRQATWKEVDLDAPVWTIPAARMKGKREHRVPLSPAAVALLRTMLPDDGKPDPDALIFPGMRKGTPLSDASLGAVLKRMGHGDLTAHGTARSTFRDWAGEATAHPREIIERALAHVLADKTEAAYARGDLFTKRAALMADWAAYCAKEPAAVHRLRSDAGEAAARP